MSTAVEEGIGKRSPADLFERVESLLTGGRAQRLVVSIAGGLVLALATAYFFAAQPARDEFCRAALRPGLGLIFSYSHDMWAGFTGRWLAMAGYAAVLPRIDLDSLAYPIVLIVLFLVWFAGFLFAVGAIFADAMRSRDKLLVALLLLALFWSGAPSHEGIYWLTGATEYGLPFALLMLSVRLATGLAEPRSGTRSAVAAGAVGILAAGAHELAGILLFGGAVCLALAFRRLGQRAALRNALILLGFAGIGLALSAGAPGNFIRSAHYAGGNLLLATALMLRPDQSPIGWLADSRLFALSLFLLMLPAFRMATPRWTRANLPLAWLMPALTLLAITGCYLLTCYVQGAGPAGRTRDMFYALFVVGWLASLVALAAALDLTPTATRVTRSLGAAGALLLATAMIAAPATAASLLDLPYALGEWRQQHHARLDLIRTASRTASADIVLPTIAPIPAPLQDNGFVADPENWANRCAATYYGVRSIRITGGAPPPDASQAYRSAWLRWFGGERR